MISTQNSDANCSSTRASHGRTWTVLALGAIFALSSCSVGGSEPSITRPDEPVLTQPDEPVVERPEGEAPPAEEAAPPPAEEAAPPPEPAPDDESSNDWIVLVLAGAAILAAGAAIWMAIRSRGRKEEKPSSGELTAMLSGARWVIGPGVTALLQSADAASAQSAGAVLTDQLIRLESDSAALRFRVTEAAQPMVSELSQELAVLRVHAGSSTAARAAVPIDTQNVASTDLVLRQQAERVAATVRALDSMPI